ncbi:MAG: N5-carboxyaminoimidazole ribonucleotide synthase [Phycisphaerae bacterium]|nr:MAG: N5-carboxyaminoimidazole ribonucleotide synthase [Phycisphaerae bacterium]
MTVPMILPGKTIGILGGGQLGRMFAIAARKMGYRVHAFDPTPDCPTGQVADLEINAPYDDLEAANRFAQKVDIVTFEFENVPSQTLQLIERLKPVHPSPFVLDTTRHRLKEKDFLSSHGFPVAPYRAVRDLQQLVQAIEELNTPCILKTAEFGYDGKGQFKIQHPQQARQAWETLNCSLAVLEGFIAFEHEVSVIVARNHKHEVRTFPIFHNTHVNHILDLTISSPDPLPDLSVYVQQQALELGVQIAHQIDLIGVLCVEMFTVGNQVIVNELAPRPHNSGHLTFDACITSQFEQQLRAVCNLPLGETTLLRPAAMANLLGDIWLQAPDHQPRWYEALTDPTVKLHLYGKTHPQKGRKMGHLTSTASTPHEARDRVLRARQSLVHQS